MDREGATGGTGGVGRPAGPRRPAAIASNWDYELRPYLVQAGLTPDLAHVTSAEVGARKPDPAVIEAACRRLGVEPSATLYVGDDWSCDVVGAVRAGAIPCWLTQDSTDAGSTVFTIRDLAEPSRAELTS